MALSLCNKGAQQHVRNGGSILSCAVILLLHFSFRQIFAIVTFTLQENCLQVILLGNQMSLHDADFGIDKSTNQRHSLQGGGCKAEAGIWMERDEVNLSDEGRASGLVKAFSSASRR